MGSSWRAAARGAPVSERPAAFVAAPRCSSYWSRRRQSSVRRSREEVPRDGDDRPGHHAAVGSSNVEATTRQLATIQRLLKTNPSSTGLSRTSPARPRVSRERHLVVSRSERQHHQHQRRGQGSACGGVDRERSRRIFDQDPARDRDARPRDCAFEASHPTRSHSRGGRAGGGASGRSRPDQRTRDRAGEHRKRSSVRAVGDRALAAFTPRPVRNGVVAFFAATFLLILIVIGRDLLRPRISDPRELARLMGLPVLARVPLTRGRFGRRATTQLVARRRIRRSRRRSRTRIARAERSSWSPARSRRKARPPPRSVSRKPWPAPERRPCSSVPISDSPRSTSGLESSDRRGSQTCFGRRGSTDIVTAVNQTIKRVGSGSGAGTLDVIPSGSRVGNPAELLFGGSLGLVLEALATLEHDHVIIDGPPMLAIADAHGLAEKADSLLLVSRPDRLTVEQAVETRERLTWLHTNVLGLVVCGRFRTDHAYGYVYAQESVRGRSATNGAQENGAPAGSARRRRGGGAHRASPDKPEHEPGVAPVERVHEGAVGQ